MRSSLFPRIGLFLGAMVLLTGCMHDKERSFTPLEYVHYKTQPELEARLAQQDLHIGDPVYIRAFKSEMQMEVWMQNEKTGQYDLFRTYPICRASGKLGPKQKEGDEQAPEGFYTVSAKQLNPNSKYYLSFDLGYPNTYDRAHGRTGSALMIHGNCLSKGCLAMTDNSIGEIYLLVEQSIEKNKQSVPVHVFPFRMTDDKMAMRVYSEWYPFWVNMKEGYDLFELAHVPPPVSVKNKQYAFATDILPPMGKSFQIAQK
ncbi:MAG: murein L,D-transpeptidase [Alphaproteobacteria bacterium]|nr:murein L,D-transpeptidase [Alphaproteobacteria bacterium]